MNSTALAQQPEKLPHLIERAAAALAKATTPAEFLEARNQAAFVYDAAKVVAARFPKAVQAHNEILAACRKAQGNALLIEARAMMHLADEYDAAQTRGEAPTAGRPKTKIIPDENNFASAKLMMTARKIRAAEKAKPGIVEKTLTAGEPTRARLMRAVDDALTPPEPPPPPPTAQAEMAAKPVAQEEDQPQEMGEPKEYLPHATSQIPLTSTKNPLINYYIGTVEACEELADFYEVIGKCENKRNTPESKIRADLMAEFCDVARIRAQQYWKKLINEKEWG
jgi:hypothetical protein